MQNLRSLYHEKLNNLNDEQSDDQNQLDIITHLQRFSDSLSRINDQSRVPKWLKLGYQAKAHSASQNSNHGIYLWGNVGSGKTFLLDLLFEYTPIKKKRRVHFHEFMKWTHNSLTQHKSQKDPIRKIARNLSAEINLLYLDEFQVTDIGDAMILAKFLEHLFSNNIAIIMSSNSAPEDLYENGLQRQRFLPAIDRINRSMQVLHLNSLDYRMRALRQEQIYNHPLNPHSQKVIFNAFQRLAMGAPLSGEAIEINGRSIQTISRSRTSIWFDFLAICGDSRSVSDYLEIVRQYNIVFISEIPTFADMDDLARRFINLIDCLYENHVIISCTAADKLDCLYNKGRLKQEFKRTQSRLFEMQSQEYFFRTKHYNYSS